MACACGGEPAGKSGRGRGAAVRPAVSLSDSMKVMIPQISRLLRLRRTRALGHAAIGPEARIGIRKGSFLGRACGRA